MTGWVASKVGSQARRVLDLGRLVVGATLVLLGFVAVLPAANDRVWQLSVVVTEGGHWSVPLYLCLLVPRWRRSGIGISGVAAAGFGTLLLLTPVVRAIGVGQELPATLQRRFGSLGAMTPLVDPRPAPLVISSTVAGRRVRSRWTNTSIVHRVGSSWGLTCIVQWGSRSGCLGLSSSMAGLGRAAAGRISRR